MHMCICCYIFNHYFCLQDVDEKLLYDTFSAFGVIVTNPKVSSSLFSLSLLCSLPSIISSVDISCTCLENKIGSSF